MFFFPRRAPHYDIEGLTGICYGISGWMLSGGTGVPPLQGGIDCRNRS